MLLMIVFPTHTFLEPFNRSLEFGQYVTNSDLMKMGGGSTHGLLSSHLLMDMNTDTHRTSTRDVRMIRCNSINFTQQNRFWLTTFRADLILAYNFPVLTVYKYCNGVSSNIGKSR